MAVMCEEENRCLTAAVSGKLDHHRAKEVMEELDPADRRGPSQKADAGPVRADLYRQLRHRGHPAHLPEDEPAAGRDDRGTRAGPGPPGVPGGRAGKTGPI